MEEPLVPLAELPTHVLAHILELLGDVADLARAACVCKLWRDEVSKGMWHSVTALHLRKFHVGCAGVIKRAVDQCRNLREVDVSGCSALHAAALLPLAALPVQVLRLADLWELRASSLLEAICQRGTLRVLDLSGTSTALDMELVDALEPCANLQEFRISHARPGMLAHLTQNCTGLTSLDLSSCSGITDACLETAALDLSCLRYARFAGCTYICHAPAALGRYVSTLVYVDLSYTAVTDHCLAILVRSQPQLQTLLLSGCMWLEGHSLQELAASPCVQHGRLQRLRLSELPRMQDVCLRALLTALKDMFRAHDCPSGFSLDLSHCGGITDILLTSLALPQTLVHLSLSCCDRVTGRGLARLKSLETLRLSGCPAITPEAMQVAAASCASLRLLELPSTLSADCLPVQAPGTGHISGIRVEGGTPMSSGRFRTRLRSRTRQTMPP
ncbi:hypothetical protein WJX72_004745 [[Myrmecia] bisecta]|uniref:F-box domain-containing protein n=1 Tax=[Myrmecia] bisecta TaxID=41462 RepID=A0AAW1P385_9CHLO